MENIFKNVQNNAILQSVQRKHLKYRRTIAISLAEERRDFWDDIICSEERRCLFLIYPVMDLRLGPSLGPQNFRGAKTLRRQNFSDEKIL